jgi:hypothetical protein
MTFGPVTIAMIAMAMAMTVPEALTMVLRHGRCAEGKKHEGE